MNKPASIVASGSDIFLAVQAKRAGKIKGEVTADGHIDDIDVRSLDWGVSSPTAVGSAQATGRRQYKHLVVVKGIDSASTGLLSALVSNDEIKEAKLTLRKAGGEALEYWVMKISQARVIGVDLGINAHAEVTETVTFAYAKIEIEYKRQQGAGGGGASTSFTDEVLAR
jgi:type VI secretion system secreted protein Hcp